ncbi:mitochondrial 2-oxodicarboxylate carrier-like [Mya arenaria]|uniref:mitochondrial 2-oxodicarboxylate carrier-like n=1 Tax=Mya arenaria TaxID=6604 RepID=UPI0022E8CF23|nr:mitochondrial 2-oxodicarboxylate carrier-like [Mya arenaria]
MAVETKQRSVTQLAAMQFVAGGCAGFVEVSIMHPLDLIKTRFQIQRGPGDPHHYTSLADCFRKIYRTEGFLAFYKGILPPLLAETPKRATKFFTFERYKNVLAYSGYLPQSWVFALAGLGSGLTEAVVINPFEVIKVKLQAERNQFKEQKSTYATAREILRKHGFGSQGLGKGMTSTLGRHGVFNMVYFGFYHNIKGIIPENEDPTLEILRRFTIGVMSGILGSVINIPFDVAKSRIQGPQPVPGEIKYRKCFATIATVYREEGFFALYKGLLPKILRLGPGGAIMFLVYEHVFDWLNVHY